MERKHTPSYSIKGKLVSAVCMLLVAVIMVVSSTYAWFTLSTAPEVKGISTAIGANGALDIRLNTGDYPANITQDTDKNTTWGNLVDLGNGNYGLNANIALLPSTIYESNGILAGQYLRVPEYAANGKPGDLKDNVIIGQFDDDSDSVKQSEGTGVRFVGGTTGLTERQYAFRNALSAAGVASSAAKSAARAALSDNGNVLANAVVRKALNGDGAEFTYDEVAALRNIVNAFGYDDTDGTAQSGLLDEIEKAYVQQFKGLIASQATDTKYPDVGDLAYAAISSTIDSLDDIVTVNTENNAIEVVPKTFSYEATSYSPEATLPIFAAIKDYYELRANVSAANTEIETLEAGAATRYEFYTDETMNTTPHTPASAATIPDTWVKVQDEDNQYTDGETTVYVKENKLTWTAFSAPLKYLIDSNGVTVNGKTMGQVNTDSGKSELVNDVLGGKGITVAMPTNTGIFADVADHCGDYKATINASVHYGGIALSPDVTMTTQTTVKDTTTGTGYLEQGTYYLKNTAKAPTGAANGEAVISEFYGIILDFEFQTNAAESNLLLQTNPIDRIYKDNNNEETLGGGSYMSFNSTTPTFNNIDIANLMTFIRIVFFDTTTGEILGYAKLNVDTVNPNVDEDGAVRADIYMYKTVDVYQYTVTGDNLETDDITETDYVVTVYAPTGTTEEYYTDVDCTNVAAIPENTTLDKKGTEVALEGADAKITALSQTGATKVSTLVYIDGVNMDNDDVAATEEMSMTGKMNIQFSSSAELKPMEYGELYTPNQAAGN